MTNTTHNDAKLGKKTICLKIKYYICGKYEQSNLITMNFFLQIYLLAGRINADGLQLTDNHLKSE